LWTAVLRILVLAFVAALVAAAPAPAKKRPPDKVEVQLLAINDFHGHLEPHTPGLITRRLRPTEVRVPAGGAEFLATHVRALERRNPNTLMVAAGDLVGASPLLSSLFHDEPAIEALNAIGLDVSAVGNHEFDEGPAELLRLQRGGCHPRDGCADGNGYRGADFPFLAANVTSVRTGRTFFPPYVIKRVGGVRIGFIGMTLEGTPNMLLPAFASVLRFADEADTANYYVRELRRRKVKAIVVLLHEGGAPIRRASPDGCPGLSGPLVDIVDRTSREVDVFLTGHTHAAYDCVIDGRRVTSAASFGRLITRVTLNISRRRNDIVRARADNWVVGQDVMRAPDITRLIARYARFADPLRKRVIGRLVSHASRGANRAGERPMGTMLADAMVRASGADAAFVNPGELRRGLPAGEITYGRAFRSLPFGSTLVTMSLYGADVLELLKEQWCGRNRQRVLQPSSGVTYTWSRQVADSILDKPCLGAPNPVSGLHVAGAAVVHGRLYRITVSSRLAEGYNRFDALAPGAGKVGGPDETAALEMHLAPSVTGDAIFPPVRDRITVAP
jgi:5'-nucleotidase